MLAIEGGPGYSTTDSRDSYLTLLTPLDGTLGGWRLGATMLAP